MISSDDIKKLQINMFLECVGIGTMGREKPHVHRDHTEGKFYRILEINNDGMVKLEDDDDYGYYTLNDLRCDSGFNTFQLAAQNATVEADKPLYVTRMEAIVSDLMEDMLEAERRHGQAKARFKDACATLEDMKRDLRI